MISFSLYGIHNLLPVALGSVYAVETSTSLYNLYLYCGTRLIQLYMLLQLLTLSQISKLKI